MKINAKGTEQNGRGLLIVISICPFFTNNNTKVERYD